MKTETKNLITIKFNDSPYAGQVKEYKSFQILHPEKKVKGFIVYSNQLECEEVI